MREFLSDSTSRGSIPALLSDERGLYLSIPEQNLVDRWISTADLTAEELDDLVELFARAFNGGPSWFHYGVAPIDHLKWKVVESPYRSQAILQETLDGGDGRPIGIGFAHYQHFILDGLACDVLQGSDYALDPSVQGRGIRSTLSRLAEVTDQAHGDTDFSVAWGVVHPIWDHLRDARPERKSLALANRLITYAKPLKWSGLRRRRPSRPEQAGASRTRDELRGYRRKIGLTLAVGLFAAQLRAVVHRARSFRRVSGEWRIETVDQFGPEADAFWASASAQFDLIQVRDREYLNWRFCDRRAGPFEVRVAKVGDQILGFAATRADQGEAVLADLLSLPGRVDVAEALLDDAIAIAHGAGSPTMRLWLQQRHPYANAVRQRGFFDTDQRLRMSVRRRRPESPEVPFVNDPDARVHAMIADSDHI